MMKSENSSASSLSNAKIRETKRPNATEVTKCQTTSTISRSFDSERCTSPVGMTEYVCFLPLYFFEPKNEISFAEFFWTMTAKPTSSSLASCSQIKPQHQCNPFKDLPDFMFNIIVFGDWYWYYFDLFSCSWHNKKKLLSSRVRSKSVLCRACAKDWSDRRLDNVWIPPSVWSLHYVLAFALRDIGPRYVLPLIFFGIARWSCLTDLFLKVLMMSASRSCHLLVSYDLHSKWWRCWLQSSHESSSRTSVS